MRHRLLTVAVPTLLALLLAGCASVREGRETRGHDGRDAHMAQAPSVAGVAEESFGKPGWARKGDFSLSGQRVRYERGAERLALFEPLPGNLRAPLNFSWQGPTGESSTVCEAWAQEVSANGRLTDSKPWVLSCRWGSAPAAMLQIGEGQMRRGKLSREGAYRRGELTVGLRSVHLLEGNAQPRTAAVGYEMLHQGTVVGSLDLSGSQPRLRRPDPATPLGRAVTEAALALALVWEPS
ncbi:hypothetical protein J2X20_001731 [Pelomonas saccharophila]|uniref:Lipoprotein n=1 Tax=Roseateles saccharophilus TaxID=304 RepID=A0ABU1YJS3_ROSSA|nr:hypothetical protein [Roseateles saccharophilus]MDR7269102.1 hypothetical protein [Roseateles saccharophilus]